MHKRNDEVSYYQYSALIIATIIGVLVISLPKVAVVSAKESAVLSTLMGGTLTIIVAICLAILGRRFPNKTIIEYSSLLLGKIIGKAFGVILAIYFVTINAIILRAFSDALKGLLLQNTPLEIIMISILLTADYLTLNGINGIARISEIYLPIIIASLLLVIGLSASSFNFVNFRPILTPSLADAVKGLPNLISAYQGYEIILLVIPFMGDHKKIIPYTVIGVGVPVFIYTLLVAMCIGVFGLSTSGQLNYPTITLAEGISFAGAFMERFDIFFVILWILAVFTTLANYLYMSSLTSVRLLGLRNYQLFVYLLSPIIYILAIIPQNILEIEYVTKSAGYLGIGISVLVLGMLLLAWISGKREKGNV